MKCTIEPPPIYEEAIKVFGESVKMEKGTVFTYGDTCHTGSGSLPNWLEPHEMVHVKQQGSDPAGWWKRFFADKQFRMEQELEAYRTQWLWVKKNIASPAERMTFLRKFAYDLSSARYGSICTFWKALEAIRA